MNERKLIGALLYATGLLSLLISVSLINPLYGVIGSIILCIMAIQFYNGKQNKI